MKTVLMGTIAAFVILSTGSVFAEESKKQTSEVGSTFDQRQNASGLSAKDIKALFDDLENNGE